MNRIVKATLWALPPIILLVIIPYFMLSIVPAQYVNMADAIFGISIATLVFYLSLFGILLAVFSFLQTWAYKWTLLKPVASSLHVIVSYGLLLFILGFGNPLTFGTSNIGISLDAIASYMGTPNLGVSFGIINIALISTLIALLYGIAVAIKIAHAGLKFREDKRFHSLDLENAASQALPQPTTTAAPADLPQSP